MARNYVALPFEYLDEMDELDDAEFGRLCRALIRYGMTGEAMQLEGNERFYAKRAMMQEDRFQEYYSNKENTRHDAAVAAANKRWGNDKNEDDSLKRQSMRTHANACDHMPCDASTCVTCQYYTKTNNYPIPKSKSNTPPTPPKGSDAEFDRFWEAYPKKVGKSDARKKFDKAIKDTTLDTLLKALEKQKQSSQWNRENKRYIPNPATWLNQCRWEDDIESLGGINGTGTGRTGNSADTGKKWNIHYDAE